MLVESERNGATCPVCRGPTCVQKTRARGGVSLAHGRVRIHETVRACIAGCGIGTAPSPLAAIFPAGATFAYDVIVRVGLERFTRFRQRDEIRAVLAAEGVDVSEAEISVLGRRFLDYLAALHTSRAPELRAALVIDGGWPMHIDATGEDGRGTLLVVYAGWRGWVLGAWKIPTEREDAMTPKLREVVERFGWPCAIMRDGGRAVTEAAAKLVAESKRAISILACHMHFLRDVGKDLMSSMHDELRGRFRHFKVLPKLRSLARGLGRGLGAELAEARKGLVHWLRRDDRGQELPAGTQGLAVVRALAQWVLDFPRDGLDQGFPFDVPMLDLYDRCIEARAALVTCLRTAPTDAKVLRAAKRLLCILRPVDSEVPFERIADGLRARRALFQELRDALRLGPRPANLTRPSGTPASSSAELDQVRDAVEKLDASLRQRRPARGPAQQTRRGIDIVVTHLERHGPNLWGHAVSLPAGGVRMVARTNNAIEGFFHDMKHDERRRSGRRVLTQDLEHLPPEAALARNLKRPDYVEILCGSLAALPAAFAALDAAGPWKKASAATDADIVSRSLPAPDRALVRNDEMLHFIYAAANSRAPRR